MEDKINYERLGKVVLSQLQVETHKHTTPTGTPNVVMAHGNGGLFSNSALDDQIFGAMVLPIRGLQSVLRSYPTQLTDPLYGIVTGVTDETGSEPYGRCDDPPYAGLMKLCNQTAPLGRYSRMTREAELDAFGKLRDRGENLNLRLVNSPWSGSNQSMVPTIPGINGNPALSSTAKAMFELGVIWSRAFARQIYAGNPINNTVGGGYSEFYGLDILINTGMRDVISTTVCPAADSYIKSFGNKNIGTACADMVQELTWMVRHLRDVANRTNLMPVEWVLSMRPMLFDLIADCWPCQYLTYRCTDSQGGTAVVDAGDAIGMRDAMKQGSYLLIDGVQVRVVQDDAIAETSIGAGVFSSQIYYVPLTVLNSIDVCYFEYFDYTAPNGLQQAAQEWSAGDVFYKVSDGGRFAWHKKPPKNWCVQFVAKTEPRLVLRTPYIAGRLTNIRYTPVVHERDWNPDDTYYVNGGGTTGTTTTYYSPQA